MVDEGETDEKVVVVETSVTTIIENPDVKKEEVADVGVKEEAPLTEETLAPEPYPIAPTVSLDSDKSAISSVKCEERAITELHMKYESESGNDTHLSRTDGSVIVVPAQPKPPKEEANGTEVGEMACGLVIDN